MDKPISRYTVKALLNHLIKAKTERLDATYTRKMVIALFNASALPIGCEARPGHGPDHHLTSEIIVEAVSYRDLVHALHGVPMLCPRCGSDPGCVAGLSDVDQYAEWVGELSASYLCEGCTELFVCPECGDLAQAAEELVIHKTDLANRPVAGLYHKRCLYKALEDGLSIYQSKVHKEILANPGLDLPTIWAHKDDIAAYQDEVEAAYKAHLKAEGLD